jgi:hypothetical protein
MYVLLCSKFDSNLPRYHRQKKKGRMIIVFGVDLGATIRFFNYDKFSSQFQLIASLCHNLEAIAVIFLNFLGILYFVLLLLII